MGRDASSWNATHCSPPLSTDEIDINSVAKRRGGRHHDRRRRLSRQRAQAGRSRPEGKADRDRVSVEAGLIKDFVAPDYLLDGILQRGFIYSLTAQTGHGKTAFAVLVAGMVGGGNEAPSSAGIPRRRGRSSISSARIRKTSVCG
jgi:hypothetical protein